MNYTVMRMRTTVSIDDDVLRDARAAAAREQRTLGEVVTEALRARFARGEAREGRPFVAVTFGADGPLPGVDITNNAAVRDAMDGA